ncbi:pyridoxamine 5'-phosphate oxidase family protein [Actinomadura barringtoniae]|uniref:Pyridoxamine 5'-phosphate oxidase family protein n=1 Tax=Actinomadura barringtoniae TaxID=1427535 RepID=A0A939T9I0_9ACTN|nr:pyridoxamine 5'-phosphate oxidase family protein [Actinomadura barringtoniae]MBO2455183.1 pyridoxamine 5'-phosphate oxidase family protein [Actinomadura barringtoniae]
MNSVENEFETLDDAECMALMGSMPVGRIVFTEHALPAVRLVNFVLHQDSVVIRTAPGSKFDAALRGAVVAFETDDYDAETGAGWSVSAVGEAQAVHDPAEVARLAALPLCPWVPGRHEQFIRIPCERISGRRIGSRTAARRRAGHHHRSRPPQRAAGHT